MTTLRQRMNELFVAQETRKEAQAYQQLADSAKSRWTTCYADPEPAMGTPAPVSAAGVAPTRSGVVPGPTPAAPIPTLTDVVVPERDVLVGVLAALRAHPRVSWAHRANSGAVKIGNRFVRFGWVGCSDIIGQMRDGRFLACECKRAGKNATTEQLEFLGLVARHGGVAFVAWSALDVGRALDDRPEAA